MLFDQYQAMFQNDLEAKNRVLSDHLKTMVNDCHLTETEKVHLLQLFLVNNQGDAFAAEALADWLNLLRQEIMSAKLPNHGAFYLHFLSLWVTTESADHTVGYLVPFYHPTCLAAYWMLLAAALKYGSDLIQSFEHPALLALMVQKNTSAVMLENAMAYLFLLNEGRRHLPSTTLWHVLNKEKKW